MKKKILLLFLFIFFLFECKSYDVLRSLNDVNDSIKSKEIKEIDNLLEAIVNVNRDVKAQAVYGLVTYVDILNSNKKISSLEKTKYLNLIKNELVKIYSVERGFNIKIISLLGLRKYHDSELVKYYFDNLKSLDLVIKYETVLNLTYYINDKLLTKDIINNFFNVLPQVNKPTVFLIFDLINKIEDTNLKKQSIQKIDDYIKNITDKEIKYYFYNHINLKG